LFISNYFLSLFLCLSVSIVSGSLVSHLVYFYLSLFDFDFDFDFPWCRKKTLLINFLFRIDITRKRAEKKHRLIISSFFVTEMQVWDEFRQDRIVGTKSINIESLGLSELDIKKLSLVKLFLVILEEEGRSRSINHPIQQTLVVWRYHVFHVPLKCRCHVCIIFDGGRDIETGALGFPLD